MIPYGRQSISEADIIAVSKALRGEFLTTGPKVQEFESKLQHYVGAPAVSVTSGTAALHCAYAALGLQPGDEIITPPITFIATQATAVLLGANVKFADIQSDTGNLNPEAVERAITNKTPAIVAVDYAGHPADLRELLEIAKRNEILLIEDAAHSIGSTYRGARVGAIADITTFSFFPTKNITTGEGGAVTSRNPELLSKAQKFARQGLIREQSEFIYKNEGPWHQEVHEFGLNYRLPDILCALGISQINQIEDFKRTRTAIHEKYSESLGEVDELAIPVKREYVDPMWHLFPIRVPAKLRRPIFEELRKNDIGVQVNYFPAHLQPVFRRLGYNYGDFPVAEQFYSTEISLPMHVDTNMLDDKYFSKISSIIKSQFSNYNLK